MKLVNCIVLKMVEFGLVTARIRRMGKVMFSVCPHLGGRGYPYPIMLCNITQTAMGQTPGGLPISHNEFHEADT